MVRFMGQNFVVTGELKGELIVRARCSNCNTGVIDLVPKETKINKYKFFYCEECK